MKNLENYVCDGQMTIFDFFKPAEPDFREMTLEEIAEHIGNVVGIKFTTGRWPDIPEMIYKWKGYVLSIDVSTYTGTDRKFIGVSLNANTWGASGPTDSMDEAIKKVKNLLDRAKEYERAKNDSKRTIRT